jgi:parallel beta-helix repeat protein
LNEIQLDAGANLANALTAAASGAIVRLGPGEFKLDRRVRLRHIVSIVGAGRDATRIVATTPGLMLDARQGCSLAGLSWVYALLEPGSLLAVRGGQCDIRECEFSGARQEIREDELVGGGAILLSGMVTATIENCIFQDNQGDAISLVDNATACVAGCSFSENGNGVAYYGGSGSVRANTFDKQRNSGVIVYNDGSPSIEGNQFTGNRQGICLFGSSEVHVSNNVAKANDIGISAYANSAGVIEGNVCTGNRRTGISFGGRGTLTRNECNENGEENIEVWGEGPVERLGNLPAP